MIIHSHAFASSTSSASLAASVAASGQFRLLRFGLLFFRISGIQIRVLDLFSLSFFRDGPAVFEIFFGIRLQTSDLPTVGLDFVPLCMLTGFLIPWLGNQIEYNHKKHIYRAGHSLDHILLQMRNIATPRFGHRPDVYQR